MDQEEFPETVFIMSDRSISIKIFYGKPVFDFHPGRDKKSSETDFY